MKTHAELFEFASRCHHAVIATAGPSGAEAALMDIAVTPELEIIFETTEATRKIHNMQDDPRVAFVIGWENNQTLQYEGTVKEPSGREQERVIAQYFTVFPHKLSHQYWPGNHIFLVKPRWIRFSDYNSPRSVEEHHYPPAPDASAEVRPSTLAGLKKFFGFGARRSQMRLAG